MGQDLRAIIPYRLKPTRIFNLPEILNYHNKKLLKLLPEVRLDAKMRLDECNIDIECCNDLWLWFGNHPKTALDISETWEKSNVVELAGPGSLFISFGKQCAIIRSWTRWREFCTDQKIFNGWRVIVKFLASLLKASGAAYIPDSGPDKTAAVDDFVFSGDSFEKAKKFLLEQCGEPLTSIETIKELKRDIYFYDDFGIKEYDEDAVLTKYIWSNYIEYATDWERKVNLAIILNWRAEVYEDPVIGYKYNKQLGEGFKDDINAHNEVKNPNAFRNKVRGRILKEHKGDVFINRCSQCNKIVRTPKAKQCFWCGYDWH